MNASAHWVPVCRLDEVLPNTGVCALVHGRQVAVFRLNDDSVYALDNFDPFSKANVISRGVLGDLKGQLIVASPVYKHHFDLKTGACLEEPEVKLKVYPLRMEGQTIWIGDAS